MKNWIVIFLVFGSSLSASAAAAAPKRDAADFYRKLTMATRTEAHFQVPMVGVQNEYHYKLEIGDPIYAEPKISDYDTLDNKGIFRKVWDRVALKDGSTLFVNGEELPLTCIWISGQDNRYSGTSDPRFPDFIMRVYLVANDYSCTGPLNPNWPSGGGKKEMWDTYVYFEIRDPTIMLPVEPMIRYRWNESHAVLIK